MAEGRGGGGRLQGKAPDDKDFANYFCTYAYLYHQVAYPAAAVTMYSGLHSDGGLLPARSTVEQQLFFLPHY